MPVNLRLSGAQTSARSESDIRINPNNLNEIIAASNNIPNLRQAQFYSADGGSTWAQTQLPAVAGDDIGQGDPAVDWTGDGTAWALAVGIGSGSNVVRSFKSTDPGNTWTFDSVVSGTQTNVDKPMLWVDHSPTSAFPDNMYALWWNNGPTFVARRAGPGGTWQAPVQVSGAETTGGSDGGDVKTNAFGDVFAFWPSEVEHTLNVAKSTDGGAHFGTPVQIATTFGSFLVGIPAQDTARGVLLYITGGAFRTTTEDMVYAIWMDLAGGAGCSTDADEPGLTVTSACKTRIWFSRSSDGGAHWDAPKKINDQNSLNDQFFPRLVVDQTSGRLMVVYYDTVGDAGRVKTDVWMQTSVDNGSNWSTPAKITNAETDETSAGADLSFTQYGDYIGCTGHAGRFFACWTDRRGGGFEEIWGAPIPIPACEFIVEKGTFGEDEVGAQPSWPSAYWLAADGFANKALGFNNPANLNAPPNPAPVITATVDAGLNPTLTAAQIATVSANLPSVNVLAPLPVLAMDPTLQQDLQRFMYPYTISFAGTAAFDALNQHQFVFLTLNASMTVGQETVTSSAVIELAKGEDPYFENLNPANPTAFPFWLSFDLRFFKATPTQTHQTFNVTNPANAGDAVRYIRDVITNLNTPGNITNGDTFENTLLQDEEQSALEFLPNDNSNTPTFNFAVARLRILSNTSTTINPVRVFFRLFQAASTVSNFSEVGLTQGTYRWGTNGTPDHKIALPGVQTDQNGNLEYVTIPCFATQRVNLAGPADLKTQTDDPNARSITTVAGSEVDTYFGCWLDVNQPGQIVLLTAPPAAQAQWDGPWTATQSINGAINVAPHQCLIAEIRFDDTPIPPNASSSTTDKLAQRNIAWIDGPNPGEDASRVMPHPFEVRSSPPGVEQVDELMVTWGSTPGSSKANFFLPAVESAQVIALANSIYGTHRLKAVDEHTIQCPTSGVTFIPIPKGQGRYAGLLSVDLPRGIRKGNIHEIVVRQVTEAKAIAEQPPPPPEITLRAAAIGPTEEFSWRQMLGAFQVAMVISTKDILLFPEERLLAWLKWRLTVTPAQSRWLPVLQRYTALVSGRVEGLGGDPGQIQPSPTGTVPPPLTCRLLGGATALLLAALVTVLGAFTGSAYNAVIAVIAVLLVIFGLAWIIKCHPRLCRLLRRFIAGAGLGAVILAVLALLGITAPQLLPVLGVVIILLAVAVVIGLFQKCF
jgi:hypothetical protein